MAFSLSGRVASGAQDALDAVLERRLQEHVRRAEEQQRAAQLKMEQERINLQREEAAARVKDRADDVAFRQQGRDIDIAESVSANTPIGQASPEAAAAMRKSPIHAPLVEGRRLIDARAIPGTTPLDDSGPREYDAYMGTVPQRETARKVVDLRRITEGLRNAPNEAAKKALGFEAIGAGVGGEIPQGMLGPNQSEITAQKLADEKRDEERWLRQNNITNAQANARQAASERATTDRLNAQDKLIRDRARPDPAVQTQQRDLTLEAARKLRNAPGLKPMTGAAGPSYLFGLRDEPVRGTAAASAKQYLDSLVSLLTVDNLSFLKGPMSDKDIQFIKSASTSLSNALDDKTFIAELDSIIERLENPTGDGWRDMPGPRTDVGDRTPIAPGTTVTLGGDTLSELQKRRDALKKK